MYLKKIKHPWGFQDHHMTRLTVIGRSQGPRTLCGATQNAGGHENPLELEVFRANFCTHLLGYDSSRILHFPQKYDEIDVGIVYWQPIFNCFFYIEDLEHHGF